MYNVDVITYILELSPYTRNREIIQRTTIHSELFLQVLVSLLISSQ